MPQWHPHREQKNLPDEFPVNPLFSRQGEVTIPRLRISDQGMLPETAYQILLLRGWSLMQSVCTANLLIKI